MKFSIYHKYKNSVKFLCRKCGYPVMAKIGTVCALGNICSSCIEGTRKRKINWNKWIKGMKKKEKVK